MKIISPLPHKRGRLEIIPLIDIMFFLLAAFMLVSINKIKVDSLKISLPTDVPSVTHETKEDFVSISVDTEGNVQVNKEKITDGGSFLAMLRDMYAKNPDQKILISADREAHHGDVMTILGKIRQAGFQKVAFSIKKEPVVGSPPVGAPSDSPSAPVPAGAAAQTPPPTTSTAPASTPTPAASAPSVPAAAAPAGTTPPAGQ